MSRLSETLGFLRTPTFGRTVFILLSSAFSLLALTGLMSLWISGRINELNERVEHTFEVRAEVQGMVGALADAETYQRGHLLTGQLDAVRDYEAARREALERFERLERLVADNPEQQARLSELEPVLQLRFSILDRTLAAARAGRGDEAIRIIRGGEGLRAMERLRSDLALVDETEAELLGDRRALTRESDLLNLAVNLIGTALIFALGFASLWLLRRYLIELQNSRAEIAEINRGLEATVKERTADLIAANEEVQKFAYIVSHDLRAPLVNVTGYTSELATAAKALTRQMDTVKDKAPELLDADAVLAIEEDVPEALGFIRTSTEKMDRLINAILKLSREGRRTPQPQWLDMTELLRGIADSVQHQVSEAEGEIAVDRLPRLESDRLFIEQIFGNLVDNALKYRDPQRPPRISIRGRDEPGGWTVYEVEDNGRGVSEADRERVFELFRRAGKQDKPGEGLGLAFVRQSVRRLGGSIELDSELGKGSTFRLKFPKRLSAVTSEEDSR
ncbi:CHASE3 domain-containing protein [Brevundimonas sp. 2R-24]|uniref:histidine kinase n=1 Tax=Peiella sedimenti TaxID=3061083 RepID=A0ABT8SJF0_9CAUL|nr:CHASE3 domain-containing protein [Caulobacteraceae bacterium XZ-24]